MTDEELFKVYIKRELCVHCGFPRFCKVCSDIATAKRHYLAGIDAGKSLAETDLAIVAYMQGAERYKPKWHKIADGDLPKENKLYLVKIKDNGLAIAYFNGRHWETRYNLGDSGHCVETVIAWCEIPTFTDKE